MIMRERRSICKVEDKDREEAEDEAAWEDAEQVQEGNAFARPAESAFPTKWEHPATK
jgi:hypothetical protein